jgi:superfamily II DNA/RNA helicase
MSVGAEDGALFREVDMSATSVHKEKRLTSSDRAKKAADIVKSEPNEQWMVWVDTDYDADAFLEEFPDAVEVRGNMSAEEKEEKLDGFTTGKIRVLLSKPSIAGMGLNWQQCARTVFMGLSFSYESYYQAVRRFWRFGQKREVEAHIVLASSEQQIWATVQRKQKEHEIMKLEMFDAMKRECVTREVKIPYQGIIKPKLPSFLSV